MIYRLIVLNGPSKGMRITVDPDPMVIGRDEGCDISFGDEEMARQHARIEQRDCELFISDLGSMNKLVVNKHETKHSRIKHGDIIELGRTRLLVEAIVQAEVLTSSTEPATRNRGLKKRKLALAAGLVLAAGASTLAIMMRDEGIDEAPLLEPIAQAGLTIDPGISSPPDLPSSAEPIANENNALNDEIRQLREDLAFIQEHLSKLNAAAVPLANPVKDLEDLSDAEKASGLDELEIAMNAARQAFEASDFEEANLILEHVQMEYPDYLPAYQLRAETLEQKGLPADAREQWTAILERATESELYRRAVAERIRLGRVESRQLVSAHESVRIERMDQTRFRETAGYDEMRAIKIHLAYDRTLGPIDPEGVRLMVYFFEQDMSSRRIVLSEVQPHAEAKLSILARSSGDLFTCAVNYVAPKGYFERSGEGHQRRYYGCIARLHYFELLVDEQARPVKLLDPAVLQSAGLAVHTADADGATDRDASF
ncbi:MAG: FHA domain-containing protein [Kiritimatiellia bacterium]